MVPLVRQPLRQRVADAPISGEGPGESTLVVFGDRQVALPKQSK